jgi:hypothetical protein
VLIFGALEFADRFEMTDMHLQKCCPPVNDIIEIFARDTLVAQHAQDVSRNMLHKTGGRDALSQFMLFDVAGK